MKTPEDEAFDDLAKRQGGFQAKRTMAADKLQGPVCDKDPHGCWNVRCQLGKQCKNLAQPAQEPVGMVKELFTQTAWEKLDLRGDTKVYITPPQRPWVGLTDEKVNQFHNWKDCTWSTNELVRHVEATLKSKNT